jgi:tetratricopeptide (TPR) repeat protein
MLETIREFALEQLGDAREHDDVSRRHAEFFLALSEEADHALAASPAHRRLIDRARPEGDNYRAAVRWALGSKTPELGLRLAASAYVFRIGPGEIARWLDKALPFADRLEPHRRALVLNEACGTNVVIGRYEQAHQLAEWSVALAREVGDERLLALTVRHLGNAAAGLGLFAEADASFRESIELSERLGDSVIEYRALHGLGELGRDHLDPDRARPLLRKAIALARKHGDLSSATAAMHGLADADLLVGELEAAESGYREALAIGQELAFSRILVYCTAGLAAVAAASGDAERAGRLWGAVETLERERGFPLVEPERPRYETFLARVDPEILAGAMERGRRRTPDEAIEYALADA